MHRACRCGAWRTTRSEAHPGGTACGVSHGAACGSAGTRPSNRAPVRTANSVCGKSPTIGIGIKVVVGNKIAPVDPARLEHTVTRERHQLGATRERLSPAPSGWQIDRHGVRAADARNGAFLRSHQVVEHTSCPADLSLHPSLTRIPDAAT